MKYTDKTCSFTGYRPKKLNACLSGEFNILQLQELLKKQMQKMLDNGVSDFQCGMAIGSDLMFAQIAVALKERYPGLVKFSAAVPCLDHDKNWGEQDRSLCRELLGKADSVVYVSESRYYDGCMAKRNRYLVDTCDELLAIYDGQRGGTMQTINYAKKLGRKVTIINPRALEIITLRETNPMLSSKYGSFAQEELI